MSNVDFLLREKEKMTSGLDGLIQQSAHSISITGTLFPLTFRKKDARIDSIQT